MDFWINPYVPQEQRLKVFENKVLRKIFGTKRDEVTGEWRKLQNAELDALHSSPDIIRNIKSRRLRWAGHVARMGESRNAYRVLVGRPEEKDLWEGRDVDGRIILKCYDGWINFENETQDRQEWRNAIYEREGKDSGFSYDLLDGARTTFRGMVLHSVIGLSDIDYFQKSIKQVNDNEEKKEVHDDYDQKEHDYYDQKQVNDNEEKKEVHDDYDQKEHDYYD
ncbi:hypothetical protein ANN_10612 [Periplaneta americana]|uniref:Uncharacterized protein n=1 Tax=Periplaneta americana TaxID=6978 RepID=A0ABQ8TRW9_PERAM|nr:hypothetical protein ANN_10612 [Periplaneta americana]